jgi:hypothetical protein
MASSQQTNNPFKVNIDPGSATDDIPIPVARQKAANMKINNYGELMEIHTKPPAQSDPSLAETLQSIKDNVIKKEKSDEKSDKNSDKNSEKKSNIVKISDIVGHGGNRTRVLRRKKTKKRNSTRRRRRHRHRRHSRKTFLS